MKTLWSTMWRLVFALMLGVNLQTSWAQTTTASPIDPAEIKRQLDSGVRHGLLFELTRGDQHGWLYGTMHVGKPGVLPIDADVMRAVQQVKAIAVEVDITDSARMQAAVRRYAYYPSGRTLADDLSADDLRKLDAWLATRGIPRESALALKPWMLGATLVIVEAQRSGLSAELGADGVLIGIARAAHKPVREIETIDEQFDVLASGSAKEQASDLMELIGSLQSGEELSELTTLAQAWLAADRAGLEAALDRLRSDPRASAQRSVDQVIIGRNRRMAERIDAMLRREPTLAAVGALHLVGGQSVLDELSKRGWTIKPR
jgi:uncharacterized protein